jgi:serine protease Do
MKRAWLIGLLLACGPAQAAVDVDEAVGQAEAQRVAAMAKACRAAVAIFADGGQDGGSGVVISPDGYALSNFHVTRAAGNAMKCGMADGRLYDAVIVGLDPVGDVALIKLLGRDDFPAAEMADSDQVRTGDWVFAVGNPFLLATDFHPSVSYGIVSGVHRYQYPAGTLLEYADCLQTDASINPGNSGGPLFNSNGQLIGINGRGSFEKRGRVNVGVGYAISINQIKHFLGHLKSGRIVDHATLGARVANDDQGRVLVSDILEDSDAYRRGLRYGDEIVTFGGRPIHTANAFKNVLGIYPKGWLIPLTYRRKGKTDEIYVRLSGVHGEQELIDKVTGRAAGEMPKPEVPGPDEPKSDEGPPGSKPKQKPAEKPRPLPGFHARKPAPMPEVVKKQFESKRGYANYYFNKLNQARVWSKFVSQGDFAGLDGRWILKGELASGGDAEFEIGPTYAACNLPGGRLKLDVGDSLTAAIDPPGSGGLLAALHLWRRLLVGGPTRFGDMYYLGTVPAGGRAGLCEALVGTYAGAECQFLFDPASGQLVALETFLRADDDPCELRFSDFQELQGRWLPHRLEVRYGDRVYNSVRLTELKLEKGTP